MIDMMSEMMGKARMGGDIPSTISMMEQMMPRYLEAMLPHISKEDRGAFATKLIKSLIGGGTNDMTAKEKGNIYKG